MRTLFIGDIVGSPGRHIVEERLADLVQQRQIDLVIANGENSASGFGITPRIAQELLGLGIDAISGGNHSWDRKEILEFIPHEPRLLRPANFNASNPGSGLYIGKAKNGEKFAVLNLQGRVFMSSNDDPFKKADEELAKIPADVSFVLVDMHAETTSEKIALGWYLDGRVTAVVGTHTHVATGSSTPANLPDPTGNLWATGNSAYNPTPNTTMNPACITSIGGNQPHENMPPYLTLTFCIALQGIFPARS